MKYWDLQTTSQGRYRVNHTMGCFFYKHSELIVAAGTHIWCVQPNLAWYTINLQEAMEFITKYAKSR